MQLRAISIHVYAMYAVHDAIYDPLGSRYGHGYNCRSQHGTPFCFRVWQCTVPRGQIDGSVCAHQRNQYAWRQKQVPYGNGMRCIGSGSGRGLVRNTVHAMHAWELGRRGIHPLLILRSTLDASFNGRACNMQCIDRPRSTRVARRDVIGRSN